ncbi:MAG: class I adenylate-forming enzyme family protein, partial [Pseudomonadota bacterium]
EDGQPVAPGAMGELTAQGENIMIGYWKDKKETDRVLRPEGLRTGDLARMDEDGFFYIIGRNSDMIKAGAHRISPKEIEEVIESLKEVSQCAVAGIPDELLGEKIVAFVVPTTGETLSPKQVMRVCFENLPRFKIPAHVQIVDNLPRTETWKLRRSELRKWFKEPDTD